MLPADTYPKRLRMVLDQAIAYMGEALLLAEKVREAVGEGRIGDLAGLAAEETCVADRLSALGREMGEIADLVCAGGPGEERVTLAEAVEEMDRLYGLRLEERCLCMAEKARELLILQAANEALLSSLAMETEDLRDYLLFLSGEWFIYGEEGSTVRETGEPRWFSFSV